MGTTSATDRRLLAALLDEDDVGLRRLYAALLDLDGWDDRAGDDRAWDDLVDLDGASDVIDLAERHLSAAPADA